MPEEIKVDDMIYFLVSNGKMSLLDYTDLIQCDNDQEKVELLKEKGYGGNGK